MATNYPAGLDNLTNPVTTDPVNNPSHAVQHATVNDALEALQAKVGVDNSAVTTSHDYKITQLQAAIQAGLAGAKSIYQDVRNQSGASITKGTPVYVSGSEGASGKLLISVSSNATEATSSKTVGLTSSTLANNTNGQILTEGILEGIDTTGAVDGDPVWLGVNGVKIFGLTNKPHSPAHLVYLGVVIRGGQSQTGSMYVKVQNGFELEELHNVALASLANQDLLSYDSTTQLWKNKTLNSLGIATQTYVDSAVSSLSNTVINDYVPVADVGQPDGVASLDSTGKIPDAQIPAGIARDSEVATAIANLVNSAPSTLDTLNELATALGNDANFSTTITNALAAKAPINSPTFTGIVGGITKTMVGLGSVDNTSDLNKPISTATQSALDGKVSKSGGSLITPSSSTTAGLSFTPASGQTANLLEFIGGPAGGGVKVGPGGNIFDAPAINANYSFVATAGGSGVVPSIIKGAASQTADLTQWQNSAGEVQVSIKPTANLTNVLKFTEQYSFAINWGTQPILSTYTGNLVISPYGPERNPLIVKGLSSQTGDLQQWQNSSGTVLSKIDSNGKILVTGDNIDNFKSVGSSNTLYNGFTTTTNTGSGSYVMGTAGSAETLFNVANAFYIYDGIAGSMRFKIMPTGLVGINSYSPAAQLQINSSSASTIGLMVKGVASQTANLQEWQNNSNSVLAKIDKDGNFNNQSSYASVLTTSVAATGGNISTTYGFYNNLSPSTNAGMAVMPWAANLPGAIVRGFAGQTANLQEWQNNSGTVLAKVDASGIGTFAQGSFAGGAAIIDGGGGAALGAIYTGALKGSPTSYNFFSNVTGSPYATVVVKGLSGQTTDLQQWQNSSGTVLAKITSTGAFDATAITVNGSPISGGLTPFSISSNTGLSSNSKYFVNTSAARTLTLPASPSVGDEIQIFDASNLAGTNNVTISSNGGKINGSVQDAIIDVNGGAMVLIYTGSTYGWRAG